ncbi:hypothetical protein [Prosthecobacter fluviatilis]|uniref:Uncharacterized protein n=1 Tax=Prosthecobacter fluviatilis TaxID=445931 RepID=A0ABW0KUM5_9BACT
MHSLKNTSQVSFLRHRTPVLIGCLLALLLGHVRADPVPPEPENFHQGVLRAWVSRGSGMGNVPRSEGDRFALGDVLVVEVKNFNGWLIGQADNLHFVDEDLAKSTSEKARSIILNGYLKRAADANLIIREASLGVLTDSRVNEYVGQGALTADDARVLADIRAKNDQLRAADAQLVGPPDPRDFGRLPLAPGRHEIPAEAVVADVLKLPSFKNLLPLLASSTAEQQVSVLEQEVPQLIKRMLRKKAAELRLRINDLDLKNVAPTNPDEEAQTKVERRPATDYDDYFWYRFPIVENEENTAVWQQLRKRILMNDSVQLTLNCPFADRSFLLPTAIRYVASDTQPLPGMSILRLVVIDGTLFSIALLLMVVCLALFFVSASRTDLIRDTLGDLRADGIPPYSLARSQMAFWFILVIGSFLFLFISLNKVPVLNNTCLWLIGIGAGTALGAAVITEDRSRSGGGLNARPFKRLPTEGRAAFIRRLDSEVATQQTALTVDKDELLRQISDLRQTIGEKKQALSAAQSTDLPALNRAILRLEADIAARQAEHDTAAEANRPAISRDIADMHLRHTTQLNKDLPELEEKIRTLQAEIVTLQARSAQSQKTLQLAQKADSPDFVENLTRLKEQQADCARMSGSPVMRLLDDWMTEEGRYSFHRYQMLIWTLVLGVVFVVTVAKSRSLPVFDDTLLALLGISNGTYLGFRLPAAAKKE